MPNTQSLNMVGRLAHFLFGQYFLTHYFIYDALIILSQYFLIQQQMTAKKKIKNISGIRDFSVCQIQRLFVVCVYDCVRVYDADIGGPIHTIKFDCVPKELKMSPNGRFFTLLEKNIIKIYDTVSGTLLQKIHDVPLSIKNIRFSGNSQKLIYASPQNLCLWNIKSYSLEVRTQNWKNINCYDVNADGCQFALGNFTGTIFLVTYLGNGKCTQVQIKRHKNCIICLCFHLDKLISVSYDGHFIISTLQVSKNGERTIKYNELSISVVPKDIQSIGDNFYMFNQQGVHWFTNQFNIAGFVDSHTYRPLINEDGQIIFVKLVQGNLEWWPINSIQNPPKKYLS